MTAEQRERLLGMILLGTSSVTACDTLGVAHGDLLAELDDNEAFRFGYLCAEAQRDGLNRSLQDHPPY